MQKEKLPYGKIMDAKELGSIIRYKRKLDGLTQEECAALANVGPRFLSELENGKPTVELGKVLLVLQCLGLDINIRPRGISYE